MGLLKLVKVWAARETAAGLGKAAKGSKACTHDMPIRRARRHRGLTLIGPICRQPGRFWQLGATPLQCGRSAARHWPLASAAVLAGRDCAGLHCNVLLKPAWRGARRAHARQPPLCGGGGRRRGSVVQPLREYEKENTPARCCAFRVL
eukprot:363116-Chlamydomonas_euryale.AAC.15